MENKKWYQKTWGTVLIGIFIVGIIGNFFSKKTPKTATVIQSVDSQTIQNITKKESKIIETLYEESEKTLYLSVQDDGSNRVGYANYICQLLHDNNMKGIVVKIMEYKKDDNSELSAGHRIILGKSDCNF